jgi:hypothetical protein
MSAESSGFRHVGRENRPPAERRRADERYRDDAAQQIRVLLAKAIRRGIAATPEGGAGEPENWLRS